MKQTIRNIMALSLLFAYSLSISISMQHFIVDTVFNQEQHHDVTVNLSDSKTPEISIFPNLEPLGEVVSQNVSNVQATYFKAYFQLFKHAETYTLTKDNQYLFKSINIQPSLDIDALLYPFHTFS
ncbi:hypothetical protein [Xanthomarina sp. F2636L]|uniref:hypothetical protein n=1 Tax=Xanthomarina sp. F2636L TaxID=2996018 RepID=UPI00225E2955|nr:hypothetical protein [Xanthomarina sp. F2636L]MCX7550435.1 hypothetical protein [Xanthomarina sp. F2636L]